MHMVPSGQPTMNIRLEPLHPDGTDELEPLDPVATDATIHATGWRSDDGKRAATVCRIFFVAHEVMKPYPYDWWGIRTEGPATCLWCAVGNSRR